MTSRIIPTWAGLPDKPSIGDLSGVLPLDKLPTHTHSWNDISGVLPLDKLPAHTHSNLVPYSGATTDVDLGSYALIANRFLVGGSTGPRLDNNAGTIRARTNNGLADAAFSALSLAASSLTGLSVGYLGMPDSVTLGWPGTSFGRFVAGTNGSFEFSGGPKFDQSGGTIRARTAANADAPISASNGTFSGTVSAAAGSFSSSLSVSNNIDTFQLILSNAVRLRNAPTYGDGELSVLGGADSTQLGKIRVGSVHLGPTTAAGSSTIHANLTTTGPGAVQLGTGTTVGAGGSLNLTTLSLPAVASACNGATITTNNTLAPGRALSIAAANTGNTVFFQNCNIEMNGSSPTIFFANASTTGGAPRVGASGTGLKAVSDLLTVRNRADNADGDLRFANATMGSANYIDMTGIVVGHESNQFAVYTSTAKTGYGPVLVSHIQFSPASTMVMRRASNFVVRSSGDGFLRFANWAETGGVTFDFTAADSVGIKNLANNGFASVRHGLQSSTAAPNTTTLPSGATWWQDTTGNTRRFAYNDSGVIFVSPLLRSTTPATPTDLPGVISILQHWGLCA